jgi:hypothetical protein
LAIRRIRQRQLLALGRPEQPLALGRQLVLSWTPCPQQALPPPQLLDNCAATTVPQRRGGLAPTPPSQRPAPDIAAPCQRPGTGSRVPAVAGRDNEPRSLPPRCRDSAEPAHRGTCRLRRAPRRTAGRPAAAPSGTDGAASQAKVRAARRAGQWDGQHTPPGRVHKGG